MRHIAVELPRVAVGVTARLDGTNDRNALAQWLARAIAAGAVHLPDQKAPLPGGEALVAVARSHVEETFAISPWAPCSCRHPRRRIAFGHLKTRPPAMSSPQVNGYDGGGEFPDLFVGLDRICHGLNVGDDVAYIDIGKPEIGIRMVGNFSVSSAHNRGVLGPYLVRICNIAAPRNGPCGSSG